VSPRTWVLVRSGGGAFLVSLTLSILIQLVLDGRVDLRQAVTTASVVGLAVVAMTAIPMFRHLLAHVVKTEVLLIRPPSVIQSAPDCGEALGLGYLAASLRQHGHAVEIIDARLQKLDATALVEAALGYHCRVIGVTVPFQTLMPAVADIVRDLRFRGSKAHIAIGGLFPSHAAEQLLGDLPELDSVVRYEGENTLVQLVEAIDIPEKWSEIEGLTYRSRNGHIISTPGRAPIQELDALPVVARDTLPLVTKARGFIYVLSSRGCLGSCSYCVRAQETRANGRRWRPRDPELVVAETEAAVAGSGNYRVSFVDDDFFGVPEGGQSHAERVARAILKRGLQIEFLISVQPRAIEHPTFALLKEAGLRSVILAADSFCQPALDRFNKGVTVDRVLHSIDVLAGLGIDAYLGLILFDPWTTLDELSENLQVLGQIPYFRPWQLTSKLDVFAGAPVEKRLRQEGRLQVQGYDYSYDVTPEIAAVYQAFWALLKPCQASLAELDRFRWGSLDRKEREEEILAHSASELQEIDRGLSRAIVRQASIVVERQASLPSAAPIGDLVDKDMIKTLKQLDREAVAAISNLRKTARCPQAAHSGWRTRVKQDLS
jgi:hypothetical protein